MLHGYLGYLGYLSVVISSLSSFNYQVKPNKKTTKFSPCGFLLINQKIKVKTDQQQHQHLEL